MNFESLKMTAIVRAYSAVKIPLLAFAMPTILELDDKRSVVRIKLGLRTRNHLGVMYFGALAMGAELSIAAKAVQAIANSRKRIDFLFKDFECEFLKRSEGHVHFVCDEADHVEALVHKSCTDLERHTQTFSGYAYCPSVSEEPVMRYKLTISMRQRSRKPSAS